MILRVDDIVSGMSKKELVRVLVKVGMRNKDMKGQTINKVGIMEIIDITNI